ncbi:MAG: 50S ribosomal protein L3 N(5)-glutamine methyltransferase [Gammaproteobacteria bacterium]|nr:50S ribosomal protein L3 N(5)-glutamine methyltransferase [Gammaproteobacteria bacterium]
MQTLITIRDFIRWGASEFNRQKLSFGHGFTDAFDEARYLSLFALSLPLDLPNEYFDCRLLPGEREQILEILQKRVDTRQPAAYITRESWFCGLKFYIDERVLVPRSPIAELIGNQFEPWIDSQRVGRILDLCTGSGCIAIACQYAFEDAEVCASDISEEALEVARINRKAHRLDDYLTLYQSDLFTGIPVQAFDIIVSNPPYVDAQDMADLSDEFRFEPDLGLAAGNDGLDLVNQILLQSKDYLSEHGILVIEVGNSQPAMMQRYDVLPMTWIDFEYGGSGVCCISAQDLRQHYSMIEEINSQEIT